MRKFLTFVFSLICLCACNRSRFYYDEGIVWHTSYHISYEADRNLADSLLPVMNEVDAILSPFNKNSAVSLLNDNEAIEAPDMLLQVMKKSREVWKRSKGYFDPSVGPLIDAYGFGPGMKTDVDSSAIKNILEYVGMDKVSIYGKRIKKADKRMRFNFSAIAKGYGCDMVADKLKESGVKNLMVEIGGEIVVSGESPRGGKWNISVDRPIESAGVVHESMLVIGITDCAVATSGDYRNFREDDSGKVGHIVNPLTGQAGKKEVIAATIVAPTCMEADACATACMAMPASAARKFVADNNLCAFLIFADGSQLITPTFKALIVSN